MFRPTVQTIRSQDNLTARILSPAIISEEFFSTIIQTCNNCIDKYTMRVVKVYIYNAKLSYYTKPYKAYKPQYKNTYIWDVY